MLVNPGGGSAEEVIPVLNEFGFELSIGVINIMDSDYFKAKTVKGEIVIVVAGKS